MNGANPDEIHLLLSSPGGSTMAGITLYHHLVAAPVRIVTYNMGQVDSIANVIYQSGDHRICPAGGKFMFHGVGFDIKNQRLELKQLSEKFSTLKADQSRLVSILEQCSNMSVKEIEKLFWNMTFMDADEALKKGLVDEIRDIYLPPGLTRVDIGVN